MNRSASNPFHSNSSNAVNVFSDCCESKEMARSSIVIGVPESKSASSFERVSFDFDCINRFLCYLSTPCRPVK